MGRIQANVGLVSGVPIEETVTRLLEISARPRDQLVARNTQLTEQQVAITDLTALVIGIQLATNQLDEGELFKVKQATSSDPESVAATINGTPAIGTHQFTPARTATAHQLASTGIQNPETALGGGEFSFRFGGYIDDGTSLDQLNGGRGIERGKIRITDRSGSSAVIDLRFALTVDDVVNTVNLNSDVNVAARAVGDRFELIDRTGQSVANLQVQEVGFGRTAEDLGLVSINVASDSAQGADVLKLDESIQLSTLNDDTGISLQRELADLQINLRDGSFFQIDLNPPPLASAVTEAENGVNAQVRITANNTGAEYDDITLEFVDDGSTSVGNETVAYDDSDPANKRLTFNIEEGQTTADDIVAALENSPFISQLFSGEAVGDGTGLISEDDTGNTSGGTVIIPQSERTLGEIISIIEAETDGKVDVNFSAEQDRLVLTDKSQNNGATFHVHSLFGGTAAEDLGIATTSSDATITSRRLLAGLQTSLVTTLRGGSGLGDLGEISITDRSGQNANVDLSGSETVQEILERINAAGLDIEARVNQARHGIEIVDRSSGSGNLVVANGDATLSADKLGLTIDDSVNGIDSRSLGLQVYHENLKLEDLNNGQGVSEGSFLITDSAGDVAAVNLAAGHVKTVGDLIDEINSLPIGVRAEINQEGDGILIRDTAGGSQTIRISDSGSSTAAADLKIAGTSQLIDINGTQTAAINGSTTIRIQLGDDETLLDLVDRINEADASVQASIFNDGSSRSPYHLTLNSQRTGRAGRLLVDDTEFDFKLNEIVAAQDALVLIGNPNTPGAGLLSVSDTNTFSELIDGIEITINQASDEPVEIRVEEDDQRLETQIQLFVDQYNKLRDRIDELTFFDEQQNATGILFGSSDILKIDLEISRLATDRYVNSGPISSLGAVGIRINEEGKLQLDNDRLRDQLQNNRSAVEQLFTDPENGVSARFNASIDRLAGEEESLLLNRTISIQQKIDLNNERIELMNSRLELERERLLRDFIAMESSIAKLQANLQSLNSFSPVPPLVQV